MQSGYRMFSCAAVLVIVSVISRGSAQFRCFTTPSTSGELNCGTADGEFDAASIEDCCLSPNGQFFEPLAGSEGCTACIVFGWFNGTNITLDERNSTYELQAGFIKGGVVQTFVTAQSDASFQIAIEERGAMRGVSEDFVVPNTTHSLMGLIPQPFVVAVTLRLDGIALEPDEEFALNLGPTNPTAMDILAGGTLGLFALPEISVVIRDLENVSLQFTEIEYSNRELRRFIQPQLQLSTTIATDLIIQVIPLNLTYARNLMLLPESLDPNRTDPDFDSNTQTATSGDDFSVMAVQVTFTSTNGSQTIPFNMSITDDTVHEADQVFVLRLEVISDVDRNRLVPTRTDGLTSLGRIIDDDPLCPDPVDPVNGMVTLAGNSVNDTTTYSCNMDFELVGSANVTCTQVDVNSAEFSPAPPVCRPLCPDPVDPVNGMVIFAGNSVNDTTTYSCNMGFELVGSANVTCTQVDVNSAGFSPAPPVCRPLCLDPVDPVNGMVTLAGNSVNDTATYSCNMGFELVGSATATCTQVDVDSAGFSPAPPVCRPLCLDPVDLVNGMVTFSKNSVNNPATYSCNMGFELVGSATVTCTQVDVNSATFSPAPPVCRLVDCGDPPLVDNGNFNVADITFASVAEYGCNEGYALSGSQSRTCQADGTWSGADPVCVVPRNPNTDNPGPIIGGVIAGLLVAALVTLGIILAIIYRRRMAAKNISLELQSKTSNQASDKAVLTNFQHTALDLETSKNVTGPDAIPASRNEAYAITNPLASIT